MPDSDLKPIPIPARQQWREFRVVYLPVLTFASLIVLIGWMWVRYVQPPVIVGEVEAIRANVVSIVAGTLQELKVDRLASVTNGQELAVIVVLEPDQIRAELAAAEADLRLMKTRMDLDRTRNVNAYSQLRTDLLLEQFNLEIARIHLRQVEGEFDRSKRLLESDLIPRGAGSVRNDFGYDVALRDRDSLLAEVATREKAVAELQAGVDRLQTAGAAEINSIDPVVEQTITAHREQLQHIQKPIVLRSPINGFVSVINHLPGEKVPDGEPILVVSAEKSSRIIAWVRQPVAVRPEVGDVVRVRRGTLGHAEFDATVVKVGRQLEEINATAVPLTDTLQRAEFGLPLIVQADANLNLIPGEAVQIRIIKHARPGVN
jgi:multidrug resistance efflux pump